MPRPLALALVIFASVCVRGNPGPESEVVVLFDGFSPGWRSHWREQNLFAKPTHYDVVTDGGRPVLHAVSRAANAGLVRAVACLVPGEARLRWAWKVQAPLVGNRRERERAFDDFAARVPVVLETSLAWRFGRRDLRSPWPRFGFESQSNRCRTAGAPCATKA